MNFIIPEEFIKKMVAWNGAAGQAWVNSLPQLLEEFCERWEFRLLPPFELSINYAAPGIRADGQLVVFKVGFPEPEKFSEIEALRFYQGCGMARLLEADEERCAMLIERLIPGKMLAETPPGKMDDEQMTRIAAGLMRQLWRPLPANHPFPNLRTWTRDIWRLRKAFDGGTGPFPAHLVDRAEGLFRELLASEDEPVLLHGDLHHYNILSAQRQPWLAIDPKGLAGECGFDVAPFMWNLYPENDSPAELRRIMARRLDIFAEELNLDRQRLANWCLAEMVLSAWWDYETHLGDVNETLALAEAVSEV